MSTKTTTSSTPTPGARWRGFCGVTGLVLGLLAAVSTAPHILTMTGTEQLTVAGFFAWGLFTAGTGIWLIRGRSKDKQLVLARQRRRYLFCVVIAAFAAGMFVWSLQEPNTGEDAVWGHLIRTAMCPILLAGALIALFDSEDYREKDAPVRLDETGRQKMRHRIIYLLVAGVVVLPLGFLLGELAHPWWEEILPRLSGGLWAAAAVLGYRLKRSQPPDSPA